MKVLIVGADGLLGKELYRDFSKEYEILGTYKDRPLEDLVYLDLLENETVKERILGFKPQIILLSAALTAVDFCENNQDITWRVNVEGTKEVVILAKKTGAFLVFYSTDYIFDGKDGPYLEEAKPNPINFYGRTKLEAERVIQKDLKHFLILRTCSLFGYEKDGKNFAMQVLNALSGKEDFKAVNDQFGTPTYAADLSRITLELINKSKEGIYNAVGVDYVNRLKFANEIAEVFSLDKGLIKSVSTEEMKQVASRPRNGGLKIDKLKAEVGIVPMSLREGIIAMRERKDRDISG